MSTVLRISRSQVRVLPGAQTAWSGGSLTRPTRTALARWSVNGPLSIQPPVSGDTGCAGRPHILSTACWCQPRTAFDGHRNDGEIDVDFDAMAGDPIDPAGYPLEGTAR